MGNWKEMGKRRVSQIVLAEKNPPANAGNVRDMGSIPGLGRCPGGGHGNPLQYSCLENPMEKGAWQDTVHRVTKSRTRLKRFSSSSSSSIIAHQAPLSMGFSR